MSSEPDHLPRRLWWVLASLTLAWGFNWTAMKTALAEQPDRERHCPHRHRVGDDRGAP